MSRLHDEYEARAEYADEEGARMAERVRSTVVLFCNHYREFDNKPGSGVCDLGGTYFKTFDERGVEECLDCRCWED